jgi:hypothetical protein
MERPTTGRDPSRPRRVAGPPPVTGASRCAGRASPVPPIKQFGAAMTEHAHTPRARTAFGRPLSSRWALIATRDSYRKPAEAMNSPAPQGRAIC